MINVSISDVISLIKQATQLSKKLKDKDLNKVLLDLQLAVAQLGEQNIELQDKYLQLKKYLEIPDNIYMDDEGFICRKNDSNKYCPHCWNKYRKLSLMPHRGIINNDLDWNKPEGKYFYECPACNFKVYSDFKNLVKSAK